MKKNIEDLNHRMCLIGYDFFKYDKKCRIYKKINPDNSIHYMRVNMDTGVITKKSCIYNYMTTNELREINFIIDTNLIAKIKENRGG